MDMEVKMCTMRGEGRAGAWYNIHSGPLQEDGNPCRRTWTAFRARGAHIVKLSNCQIWDHVGTINHSLLCQCRPDVGWHILVVESLLVFSDPLSVTPVKSRAEKKK